MTSPLTLVISQPTGAPQMGSWSYVGAASGWQAVSSGNDTAYIQLPAGLCQLPSQIAQFTFATPSVPAGAQIYSVGIRVRFQCCVPPPVPLVYHWFETLAGTVSVSGAQTKPASTFFTSPLPTNTVSGQWITQTVYTATVAPDGKAWNTATNLKTGNFAYEIGRGDLYNVPILVSEVYLDIYYQAASTVTVTAPTGTVSTTKATLTWTTANTNSQPQQAFQTAIYTQAQTLLSGFAPFDTTPIDGTNGFVLGPDQRWTSNIDFTNGQYVGYVQAASQWAGLGSFLSAVGSTSWTRTVTSPPANAVFSSATFDAVNNRVQLKFKPGGASPATTKFTVYASRDGGQLFQPIPSLTYVDANGMSDVTVYDYVAPLKTESQYYVVAYGGTPLQAAAGPSSVLSVTPTGDRAWLKHPSNPILNTVLPIKAPKDSDDGIKITKRRTVGSFQLLGGAGEEVLPFFVFGPTHGDEYEIELWFGEGDEDMPMSLWPAVDALDRSGSTLLLQFADGTSLWVASGVGASGQDTEERFNAVAGDPTTIAWRRRKVTLSQTGAPSFY